MYVITAPRRFAPRERVAKLLAKYRIPASLRGEVVVLRCRRFTLTTPAVADEVVKQILVDRGAKELALVSVPFDLALDVYNAAEGYDVWGRVRLRTRAYVGV